MSNLNKYDEAKRITKLVADGKEVLVEVVSGKKRGSIGKVVEVVFKHYSRHHYRLDFADGSKVMEFKAAELCLCEDPLAQIGSMNVSDSLPVQFTDLLGQAITVGCVITFPRASKETCCVEMVIGTVKEIKRQGLFVLPFMVNGKNELHTEKVRVSKPEKSMIMDKNTLNHVMLSKLSAA